MYDSIGTVLSGMVLSLVSFEDSRHWGAGITDTGVMDGVVDRSGNAEQHSIWNRCCWKVLSMLLCTCRYPVGGYVRVP